MRLGELHSGEYRQRQTMTESNLEMTVHKLRTRQVGAVLARLVAVLVGALFFLTVTVGFAQTARDPGTAQRRAAHLRHGINLSEWFAQVYDQKGYTKEHFETWNTEQDIALIRAMGFDHVRLSVNPQPMFRRNQADR